MKLKYTFESVELGDEIVGVPVGESVRKIHGVLKLNKEGAEILQLLKTETTKEDIVKALSKKYENDPGTLSEYVHAFIGQLRSLDLLSE